MNRHERYRKNQTKAANGGPEYRATDAGKGDVNRTRSGTERRRYDLGLELCKLAETHGKDSPEYLATLKEWKNAQG